MPKFTVQPTNDGHYQVTQAPNGRPVALIYAHFCGDHHARRRAERVTALLNGQLK